MGFLCVSFGMINMKTEELKDGQPCSHPGCLSHVSYPCEGCGRVAGKRVTKDIYFTDPLPNSDNCLICAFVGKCDGCGLYPSK